MIYYLKGDATQPRGPGRKTIAHIVNDAGLWGAGFTKSLTKRWPNTELKYYEWIRRSGLSLGDTYVYSLKDMSHVDDPEALFLFNMCAQHGVGRGNKPIRYMALDQCLEDLGKFTRQQKTSVHTIRLGCGLAGGTWNRVLPLLEHRLSGVEVFVYDL